MNINYEMYRIFYEVASIKNITRASEKLMISQPAISKTIKNLENYLGGTLFTRTKRGVFLTPEGEEFYKYISVAMEYIENAESKFNNLINLEIGKIRIGVNTTITRMFLLPFLEKFHEFYPKIDIQIITGATRDLIYKLKNGLVDLVFLNYSDSMLDDDLNIIKCKKITECFIVGKKYEYLKNKKLSLKDLIEYPLILQTNNSEKRKFLDDYLKKYNITLKPSIELANYSLVTEFTKIGFGIGYATKEYIEKEIKNKELFILNIEEKIPHRYIGIATSKNHLPNFSAKKLIEIITDNVK